MHNYEERVGEALRMPAGQGPEAHIVTHYQGVIHDAIAGYDAGRYGRWLTEDLVRQSLRGISVAREMALLSR